ncbi:hypothetical protein [Rhodobacter xanthinilyticus]|uniref:hypothetical protein n=1 Tax=Rhodobacter xanthinilyticus TaxID=1850250 RepID=UPI0012ECBA14|nr:hypothetical protein [Rhodobacter xanthinilyticus]
MRGGLLRIPAFKSLAVLFAGQVADQAFDHGGGIGIPFRQIDKRAAQNDLAPGIELARPSSLPGSSGQEVWPWLGHSVSLPGPVLFLPFCPPVSAILFKKKSELTAQL